MISTSIEKYISKRYERWLDYAIYHCSLNDMKDEAMDVLNEVLLSLCRKNNDELKRMLESKKNGYTELDFFVLRMIKLNATSDTSPYRSKYKPMPVDRNVDYTRIEIEDMQDAQEDTPTSIFNRFEEIREVIVELDLSPLARKIFEYRFFCDESFSDWEGPESLKQMYEVYNGVLELIKRKINGESIF